MEKECGVAADNLTPMTDSTPPAADDPPQTIVQFQLRNDAKKRISKIRRWEARSETIALELTGRS